MHIKQVVYLIPGGMFAVLLGIALTGTYNTPHTVLVAETIATTATTTTDATTTDDSLNYDTSSGSTSDTQPDTTVSGEDDDFSSAEDIYFTCPFSTKTNRTIIDFTKGGSVSAPNLVIEAHGQKSDAYVSLSTTIEPGRYTVSLASADDHALFPAAEETKESWSLRLLDSSGSTVAQSSRIRDIKDSENTIEEVVNTELSIERPVVRALGVHAAYPSETPHTFAAVCAALDRIDEPASSNSDADSVDTTMFSSAESAPPDKNSEYEVNDESISTSGVQLTSEKSVTTFKDCVAATGIVLESYPRQCRYDGLTYIEEVLSTPTNYTECVAAGGVIDPSREYVCYYKTTRFVRQAPAEEDVVVNNTDHVEVDTQVDTVEEEPVTSTGTLPSSDVPLLEQPTIDSPNEASPVPLRRTYTDRVATSGTVFEEADDSVKEKRRKFLLRAESSELTDTDADGITDYDETNLYGTDPYRAYSAGDTRTDGERLLLGLNPLSSSTEPVQVESAQEAGEVVPSLFRVTAIALATSSTPNAEVGTEGGTVPRERVRVEGYAAPNAFVTIYFYSKPVVVTVRTDSLGRFEYELDVPLADGTHELYVATVTNTGRIVAKSEPIPFVKEAQAISFVSNTAGATPDPAGETRQNVLVIAALLLIALVLVSIALLGIRPRTKEEVTTETSSEHD